MSEPRSSSEYLDPEITGEGHPQMRRAPRPHIPDYKHLEDHPHYSQYFGNTVMLPFPSWIYHADGRSMIVRTAKEAREYGVTYDLTDHVYRHAGEWTTRIPKAKPSTNMVGKSLVVRNAPAPDTGELIANLICEMQKNGQRPVRAVTDLANDPDYAEFLAFKAFKARERFDDTAANTDEKPEGGEKGLERADGNAFDTLTPDQKKAALIKVADETGIKIDKRWSLDRIEDELKKNAPAE